MSETISRMPAVSRAGLPEGCEWDFRSASDLAAALWKREICPTELVERTIARIEALDQRFNAVVVRDFDRARDAAKRAAAALARGVRKPLLGVPSP
jgi:amidase